MTTWQPPDDPDVHGIMDEAVRDTREGRYEVALAKFRWFHENSRSVVGLGGVRLSFALGYWIDLAEKFPPALDALYATRDESINKVFEESNCFPWFHEMASINRTLNEFDHTAEIFKRVFSSRPECAESLYHVAEPSLIKAGEFALCGQFLDPAKRIEQASESYRLLQDLEKRRSIEPFPVPPICRKRFVEEVTTLVTLLVLNNRHEEAQSSCSRALETFDDDEFRLSLDTAMTGHFPTIEWPGKDFLREMESSIEKLKQKKKQEG
ncbi:MAG: hypothetical protein WEB58_13220 [Planctomycetaceae bacterium]